MMHSQNALNLVQPNQLQHQMNLHSMGNKRNNIDREWRSFDEDDDGKPEKKIVERERKDITPQLDISLYGKKGVRSDS